mmetsp:Transcript_610/g.1467  ORF Transcript_610/g.1467 Transcript_610/m.1467 type:complete len:201 (-) Transcript_610:194-796(-)
MISPKYLTQFCHSPLQICRMLLDPAAGSGPPLSIGWKYLPEQKYNLSEYEKKRSPFRRRERRDLYVSPAEREQLLYEWCCPPEDIEKARRDAMYIQYCREKTVFSAKSKPRKPPKQARQTSNAKYWPIHAAAPTNIGDCRQPDSSDTSQPFSSTVSAAGAGMNIAPVLGSFPSSPALDNLRASPTPGSLFRHQQHDLQEF